MTGNAAFLLAGLSQSEIKESLNYPMTYKGQIGSGQSLTDLPLPLANRGCVYKISSDGEYQVNPNIRYRVAYVSEGDKLHCTVKIGQDQYVTSAITYESSFDIELDSNIEKIIPDSTNPIFSMTYLTVGSNKVLRLYAKTSGLSYQGINKNVNDELTYANVNLNPALNIFFDSIVVKTQLVSSTLVTTNSDGSAWEICSGSSAPSGGMIFKGFVGTVAQPDLPLASQANKGWMYIANDNGNYSTTAASYFKPESGATERSDFYMIEYSDQECTQQIGSTLVEWMGQYNTNVEFPGKFVYHFNNGSYSTLDALTNLQVYNGTVWNSYTPGQSTNYQLTNIIKISGQVTAHKDDHFVSTGTEWVRLPGGGDYPSAINNQLMGSLQTSSGFLPMRERAIYDFKIDGIEHVFDNLPRFGPYDGRRIIQICGVISNSDRVHTSPIGSKLDDDYEWSKIYTDTTGIINVIVGEGYRGGYVSVFVKWLETN